MKSHSKDHDSSHKYIGLYEITYEWRDKHYKSIYDSKEPLPQIEKRLKSMGAKHIRSRYV